VLLQSTLRQAWSRELPETAKCVQVVDVQCVLQFTSLLAAGCALHRRTSRVIHRSELFRGFFVLCAIVYTDRSRTEGTNEKNPTRGAEARWRQAALSLRPRPRGVRGGVFHCTASVGCKTPAFPPLVCGCPPRCREAQSSAGAGTPSRRTGGQGDLPPSQSCGRLAGPP